MEKELIRTGTLPHKNFSGTIIQEHVPLHDKNWFGTGGAARFYSEPTSADQFATALNFASTYSYHLHVLGNGANSLISDGGFDGLIIRPMLTDISIISQDSGSCLVEAGCGITMQKLIAFCLDNCVVGLEELSGIPGTVGGSVYNNLHYFEYSLSDFLVGACIIDRVSGTLSNVDKEWLSMGYDHSKLHEKKHYLISATFKLRCVDRLENAYAKGRHVEIVRHRQKRYPTARTCGCFFRNFHAHELTKAGCDTKIPFVAYYLDNVGIKGTLQKGNARVSHQHANMIITLENAKSADIIAVANTMQEKVFEKFGLLPQPECELIGFAHFPLRQ